MVHTSRSYRSDDRSGKATASWSAFILCVLVIGSPLAVRAGPSGGEKIVREVIEAYGGRGALSGVETLSLEGRITAFFPPDAGTYSLKLKRDGKLRVDIAYSGTQERRILKGGRGYSGAGTSAAEVQGMAVSAMVYQYDQMDLPFGLAGGTFTVRVLRRGMFRGRSVEVVEVRDRKGKKRMEADIDRTSHHIVRTAASFGMGGEQAVLSAEFGDFRKVHGVLLPFLITNYAGDIKISETRIEAYTINGTMSDEVFSP